jgi:hypothetical protein
VDEPKVSIKAPSPTGFPTRWRYRAGLALLLGCAAFSAVADQPGSRFRSPRTLFLNYS